MWPNAFLTRAGREAERAEATLILRPRLKNICPDVSTTSCVHNQLLTSQLCLSHTMFDTTCYNTSSKFTTVVLYLNNDNIYWSLGSLAQLHNKLLLLKNTISFIITNNFNGINITAITFKTV